MGVGNRKEVSQEKSREKVKREESLGQLLEGRDYTLFFFFEGGWVFVVLVPK